MPKATTVVCWSFGAAAAAYGGWRAARYALAWRNAGLARGKKFLILGAGFGGREAALELARSLPGSDNGEITLVDQRPFLLFTPMLTEAAGGDVKAWHITAPVTSLPRNIRYVQGSVESIDLATRSAALKNGASLTANHLVIALGSSSNFHHAKGVEDVALTVKSLDEADAICRRALQRIREAADEPDAQRRKVLLTFVVAGGGYTGVETIAAVNDLVKDEIAQRAPGLNASEVRMLVVEPQDRILTEVTPDLAAYARQELEKRGVEFHLKTGIKEAKPESVVLSDGQEIPCGTLIWSAGIMPAPVVQQTDGPKGKQHGLQAEKTLAVVGKPGVWAIGDCAEIPQTDDKNYAPTAQNATREGVHVARNIIRSLRGEPLQEFRYTPIGQLALVGKRRGVARIYGHSFSGMIAWAMWRGIYLAKMPGVLQRMRIAADWLKSCVYESHPAADESPENRAPRNPAAAQNGTAVPQSHS